MTYMLAYMVFNECGYDKLFNDYSAYCWYKGCWPEQFLYKGLDNFLYILRAMNDAAIVWKEGLDELSENPDRTHVDEERDWAKLSAQTFQTIGSIAQDVTGFKAITEPDYKNLEEDLSDYLPKDLPGKKDRKGWRNRFKTINTKDEDE